MDDPSIRGKAHERGSYVWRSMTDEYTPRCVSKSRCNGTFHLGRLFWAHCCERSRWSGHWPPRGGGREQALAAAGAASASPRLETDMTDLTERSCRGGSSVHRFE